jgi:RNA recognition motif-containing protein
MGKKLYVGNLSDNIGKNDLEKMFTAHGTVISAQVVTDRDTGRSRGFGFVEMGTEREAEAAIAALNGRDVEGRNLTVSEARAKEGGDRDGSGGGRKGGRGAGRR